ncbi:MAG: ankyrin repeat domain-containing protein [Acidobacteriota bacterium]
MRSILSLTALATVLVLAPALTRPAQAATNGSSSAMADAAAREDWKTVRQMLAQKADVNAPQVDGATALHWAAHYDDLAAVKDLLAAGANAKTANRYGVTPLTEACVNGDEDVIALLLKAGADPNAPQGEGETPLMTASKTGNPAAIKLLLDSGAQINTTEPWRGQTALMWAAAEGHADAVKLLIAKGATVDAKSKVFDFTGLKPKPGSVGMNFPRGGFTPLLFAARDGQTEVLKILIAAGADVNLPDPDGTSALLMAVINFHFDIAGYLLEHGADANASDSRGRAPLYAIVDMRDMDVTNRPSPKVDDVLNPVSLAKLLLEHKAAPDALLLKAITARAVLDGSDAVMGPGSTPFLRAAHSSDMEMMKLLLAHGANPKLTTKSGVNALMLAAGNGWRDGRTRGTEEESVAAIKFLMGLGLDIKAAASNGDTALHGAAGRGADLVAQALVDLGAEINVQDKTGRTPHDVANAVGASLAGVRSPHESTVALLAKLGGVPGQTKAQAAAAPPPPPADAVNTFKVLRIPAEPKPTSSNQ